MFRQIGTAADDEPSGIHKPAVTSRLFCREAFFNHCRRNEMPIPMAASPAAQNKDPLRGKLAAGNSQRRIQSASTDSSGSCISSLNMQYYLILFQQTKGVQIAEIFKLNHDIGESFRGRGHKFIYKRVVFLAP